MLSRRPEIFWGILVLLTLLLAVWWFPGNSSVETDTFGVGYGGKRVFYQLLESVETEVFRATDELAPLDAEFDRLLILGPARYPSDEEWRTIHENVFQYDVSLVFAANHGDPAVDLMDHYGIKVTRFDSDLSETASPSAVPADNSRPSDIDPEDHKSTNVVDTVSESDAAAAEDDPEPGHEIEGDIVDEIDPSSDTRVSWDGERERFATTNLVNRPTVWRTNARLEFDSDAWEVLVSVEGNPQVARRRFGASDIVVVATDDIFTNGAMLDPARAQLAYRIVEQASAEYGENCVDEFLNSSGPPKVVGILFDPALRPLTLQLILITILFGWAGSHRFGPIRVDRTVQRRNIEEHAEAIGVMHYQLKGGGHSVASLLDFLTQELIRQGGPPASYVHAETIARMTRRDPDEVMDVLLAADSMPRTSPKSADAARLLRRLADLIHGLKSRNETSNPD